MLLDSASNAESADQFSVAGDVFAGEVLQQPSALSYHCKEPSPRVVVMLVVCEVIFKPVDASGEECYLHFRGTGITLAGLVLCDYFVFLVF